MNDNYVLIYSMFLGAIAASGLKMNRTSISLYQMPDMLQEMQTNALFMEQ